MFVNRMMNDPDFAARIQAQQAEREAASNLGGCPLGTSRHECTPEDAERYLSGDAPEGAPPPISKEEDEAWRAVKGREGEVKVVAQSLVFVGLGAGAARAGGLTAAADATVAADLARMLNDAYAGEAAGAEAFRDGHVVDAETVAAMLADDECRWVTIEAANGRDVESDGAVLGAACFSLVGERAELRFFAVQPKYRGLCVGRRLLARVEQMAAQRARQLAVCIPSPRTSMRDWAERRGFEPTGASAPFPTASLPFNITRADARVLVYAKPIKDSPKPPPAPPAPTRLPEIEEDTDDDGDDDDASAGAYDEMD